VVTKPLVSVITPTWGRHEKLLNRCVPGVQAQAYQNIEHVIVSDGPDPELRLKLDVLVIGQSMFYHPVRYFELPERDPGQHWGHFARLHGIERAEGDLIAYVDDDDALRPDHVRLLAAAMDDPGVDWAYSVMASHSNAGSWTRIGEGPPGCGQVGTPMIMHRRSILEHGTWGPASSVEDWELVQRWLAAGLTYAHVREVTVDVWPSAYWG
jgi:cellulose synthase/poly-beta-1,6-N-acetylglucosamine synthase-like glycosyltransferase